MNGPKNINNNPANIPNPAPIYPSIDIVLTIDIAVHCLRVWFLMRVFLLLTSFS
ncbi:MAG: hypothetical protein ACP5OA_05340 [Candidatus Woesearchaeota archaeon]